MKAFLIKIKIIAKDNQRIFLVVLFLVVAVLIPYGQVLGFDFVTYDDNLYITENARVAAGLTIENVVWAFTTGEGANWHPLTWLSYLLDVQIFGATNAAAFHIVNVLFHAVNSVLLFLLLHRMTRALWPSVFVAALFAVHPLHVESVAWISERKDVLSTFFGLLAMMAYVRYVAFPGFSRYLLVVLFFVLGLMSKPMLVTLPAVLLLLDYWPLRRMEDMRPTGGRPNTRVNWLLIEKLPLFALAVGSSVVTLLVQERAVVSLESFPLWLRAANAVVAYAKYIAMTAMPVGLAAFYPHPGLNLALWQVVVAGAFLGGVSVVVVLWRKNRPYLLVGWLWYLGTLVPVIGLVQVGAQAFADRYTYIPLIGLFIMLFYGVADLVQSGRLPKKIFVNAGMVWVAVLMICSVFQVHLWRDTSSLFNHALQVTSSNYMAHNNLGVWLLNGGRPQEAIPHFTRACEIRPSFALSQFNLGLALAALGRDDEAIPQFLEALRLEPNDAANHFKLARVLARKKRNEEAIEHYQKAAQLDPKDAEIQNSWASVLAEQGRFEEAIGHFEEAIRLKPDHLLAIFNLGLAFERQGRIEDATRIYTDLLRVAPVAEVARERLNRLERLNGTTFPEKQAPGIP